ncbi:MAG: hypothetical protein WC272_11325 [Sulfurimonas sp.]|jgi:hypothetical protein
MTSYRGKGLKVHPGRRKFHCSFERFEVENYIDCPDCKQTVITYILETHSKTLSFYVEPHLDHSKITMADAVKVEVAKKRKSGYDLRIYCPICGKPTMNYGIIPFNAKVEAGPEKQLILIPLDEIPKDCIIASEGIDLSNNPSSLEKWFRGSNP